MEKTSGVRDDADWAPIIIIADDHPLFRDALRLSIESRIPLATMKMAGDFREIETVIGDNPDADLLLLDLTMPGTNGFAGLIRLRTEYPALPIVMVSASEDSPTIRRCVEMGASGFIPKSSSTDQIRHAIGEVLAGQVWVPDNISLDEDDDDELSAVLARFAKLTPQQNRVLSMLADGLLNKQIAFGLDVSEATVKAHVSAVLAKLGVDNRTQAVIMLSNLSSVSQPDVEDLLA